MGEVEQAWVTMPVGDLMTSVVNITGQLVTAVMEAAADEGAYQRAYWEHWQKCPSEWSVSAAVKDCELACRGADEARRLSQAVLQTITARRETMLAILEART